jgi:hypothetical protein
MMRLIITIGEEGKEDISVGSDITLDDIKHSGFAERFMMPLSCVLRSHALMSHGIDPILNDHPELELLRKGTNPFKDKE